jgi:hypothetical protein
VVGVHVLRQREDLVGESEQLVVLLILVLHRRPGRAPVSGDDSHIRRISRADSSPPAVAAGQTPSV